MAYDLSVKWDPLTAETGEADGRETLYVDGFVIRGAARPNCYVAGKTDGVHAFVFLPKTAHEGDAVSVNGVEIGKAHITSAPGSEWGLAEGTLVQQASVEIPDDALWLTTLRQRLLQSDGAEATGDTT